MSAKSRLSQLEKAIKPGHDDEPTHIYVVNDASRTVTRDGQLIDWLEYEAAMLDDGGIILPDNGRGGVSDIFIHLSYESA